MFFKQEVFSLWIGPELSIMEQVCISSYLSKNINFILYVYEPVKNVPQGTAVENANKIIPYTKYTKYNNPSFFSNLFRYKRLYELGGIWVDMDLICLKSPITLMKYNKYIFSSEISNNKQHINAGIIGCPQRSLLMHDCYQEVKQCIKDKNIVIKQGMLGPKLLKKNVEKHNLEHYVEPYFVFCVYGYKEIDKIFLKKDNNILNDKEILGIHLWNNVVAKSKDNLKTQIRKDSIYYNIIKKFYSKNTFNAVVPFFQNNKETMLSLTNNNLNICVCNSETTIKETKNNNPSCTILLVKKDINTFISSINKNNTNIYSLVDKVHIENFSNYTNEKKNSIKNILKINV